MWPPHLPRPSAGMSEQTRREKVAAGKKLLQKYQQRKGPDGPGESKKRKKTKKGGNPKTNTTGDGHPTEGATRDHADPRPPWPLGTGGAALGKSGTGPSHTKAMDGHDQHPELALDSAEFLRLCSEIQQLKQEKEALQDRQGKELETLACAHEALRAELQQHQLWAQRWVEEKLDLQAALAHLQQGAEEAALEQEGLTSRLQAAQQRVEELETKLSAVSSMQSETELNNLELTKALNRVTLQLQQKSRSCEDLEDENIELRDRLDALLTQKANMKIQINKCQRALVERAELERQLKSMRELATTFKLERDSLEEDLRVESSMGKEKARQLLEEVGRLREEKEQGARQVLELEGELAELREQLAELQRPAGPSQAEQQLQTQALQLQKELKTLEEHLHLQVEENQSLHLQSLEQQQRLWLLEKKAEEWEQHAEDRRKILETMEKEQETTRRTLVCNRELNEQLAQLQDAWQRLSAEKESLAGLLHAEQQEKKHLQEKLEQREETFKEWKEMAESKQQEAQELQDQSLAQLQQLRATCEQHLAAHQQLSVEKEALQQHLQKQTQLLEQLQQKQVQSTLEDRTVPPKFQEDRTVPPKFQEDRTVPPKFQEDRTVPPKFQEDRTVPPKFQEDRTVPPKFQEDRTVPPKFQEDRTVPPKFQEDRTVPPKFQEALMCLEATRQENAQLRAQLSLLALSREGEGVSRGEDKGEEAASPAVTVPEDVDNPHTMWDFYCAALSVAESKKVQLSRELQEQQAHCEGLAHLAAQCQRKLEHQTLYPKIWNHGVSGEREQDSQEPKKRLKICFTYDMPGQVDDQSQVDDLPHRCSLLSERISAVEEEMASCEQQMAVLGELQREKDESVRRLSQEKREKKKELQELLLRLAGQGTEGRDARPAAALTPAAEMPADLLGPEETVVEEQQGFEEEQPEDNLEPEQGEAEVSGPSVVDNPTLEQRVPPSPDIQQPREPADPGNERPLPFFYRLMMSLT
ncbi:golgin subfamily A member 2-like [Dipodomys merriami]|uniref:golgin subfamily A member 2-like n=1 Tax=Dipodomys merriami TaxID=94247 RepID=UPI0038556F0E